MKPAREMAMWSTACLVALISWIGCQQKGDVSPASAHLQVLIFIDSLSISPHQVAPEGQAAVEAYVRDETNQAVVGEDVHFTVSRGAICMAHSDTTIQTDAEGCARATYTAPPDTGAVQLRVQLPSTWEVQTATIVVAS